MGKMVVTLVSKYHNLSIWIMFVCMEDVCSSSLGFDAKCAWALNFLPLFLWSYCFERHSLSMWHVDVAKIHHYVQIVRRNRRGYGLEGIRAHTHNTIAQYFCEKERGMGKCKSTSSHKTNKRTRGSLTHIHGTNIRTCSWKGEVHGQARINP